MDLREFHAGTGHLSDEQFFTAFEGCDLPGRCFHHADHIRLAWLSIRRLGEAAAEEYVAQGIRRFAARQGHGEKYHHTMTLAWVRLVACALRATPHVARFEEFAGLHPELFNQGALTDFYSPALLSSARARAAWVEPDLRPLP